MMDAIRNFIEVHPVFCAICALIAYGIVLEFRVVALLDRRQEESDGLPKDWPYRGENRKERNEW